MSLPEEDQSMPNAAASHPVSAITQLNLILLCAGLLFYTAIRITAFLPEIAGMIGAALLLSYLLLGPVRFLERRVKAGLGTKHPKLAQNCRTPIIIMVYLLCIGILTISAINVVPPLLAQTREVAHDFPHYLHRLKQMAHTPRHSLHWTESSTPAPANTSVTDPNHTTPTTVTAPAKAKPVYRLHKSQLVAEFLRATAQELTTIYHAYAASLGKTLLKLGARTAETLVYTLTTMVLVFYMLSGGEELRRGMVQLLPNSLEPLGERFLNRVHHQFYRLVRGQLLMSLIGAGLVYVCLLGTGMKYALLLSVVFGGLSIIPVMGPTLGFVPLILLLGFTNHPTSLLLVCLLSGAFYLIKTIWIWPRLLEKSYQVHPVLFILAFLACIRAVGFAGLFLTFPVASLLGATTDLLKNRHVNS